MAKVRPFVLAGTWYPAQPEPLREQVASYLATAATVVRPRGTPRIAIVPHAGYDFSGPTAGRLYSLLAGHRYDAVFILAPSHRTRLPRAALSGLDAFATPLGEVPIAVDIVQALASSPWFDIDDRAHAFEHAVEIQLPLLQCALPAGTPIVPILVPHLDRTARQQTAAALDRWRDDRHLLLVSSDFTHYGREYGYVPFTEDVPTRLEQLDTGAILKILAHDSDGLVEYGAATGITMCGLDAVAVALSASPPAGYEAALLGYARSARPQSATSPCRSATRRSSSCAAEAAIIPLTARERALPRRTRSARRSRAAVRGERAPDPARPIAARRGVDLQGGLSVPRGAFVTLTDRAGQLARMHRLHRADPAAGRGRPDGAAAAATDDPRFVPLREDDVAHIEIEVSVLSPLRSVPGPQDIEIGRHGILLRKGRRRAVFLPQVADRTGLGPADHARPSGHQGRARGRAPGETIANSRYSRPKVAEERG